jgi:short-subunit dehydrogenase
MRSLVMITGATGGLGKAFAVECARRGWDLFLTDLDASRLGALAHGLDRAYGIKVHIGVCDLTDDASRSELLRSLRRSAFRFHMLINVAGTDFEGPFVERSRQQLRTILRLNVEAALELSLALLQRSSPDRTFRIINVASLAAFFPMPSKAIYAASKRFLLDFSLALRHELRAEAATVTVLCPAGLPTNDECMRGIEAQGLFGLLTTRNIGPVASQTVEAALQGRSVVIPGWINRLLPGLGSLLPKSILTAVIGRRWQSVSGRGRTQVSPRRRLGSIHQPERLAS